MNKFNEFELLTLREGLFAIKRNPLIINEEEFNRIDTKLKTMIEELG